MRDDSAPIDRVWPEPRAALDDDDLLAGYAFPRERWLRMNFIASLDGAATRDGRSGALGDAADRRLFALLRRQADAVLVGAGTVRTEGYGPMRLGSRAVAWRAAHGLPEQPAFVLVSRSLDLDPESPVFTEAPVVDGRPLRPIVATVEGAPPDRRGAIERVAEVIVAGAEDVDARILRRALGERGLGRIHAEGGPTLFGAFLAAGAVDELCLTLAPSLEGGSAPRIAHGAPAPPLGMALASVLRAGDELLLRYARRQ